ncbi:MAG: hypothetical protein RRA94_00005, partial [Bacteroidota bacterium]|nr:hypothetical protein [Bacteroidota bacterium]
LTAAMLCGTASLVAQEAVGDSTGIRDSLATAGPGSISLGFERNVNTFLWDFGGNYRFEEGPWQMTADERFQRTLIRTDRSTVKDEQSFRLDAMRELSKNLAVTTSFSSFIFSDNRALALNDLSTNKALAGVRWSPLATLQVTPMAGVSVDNQQGIEDLGLMYAGSATLHDLVLGRNVARADLYASAEYIDPRFQSEQRGSADLLASFGNESLNHTQLTIRNVRREFYLAYDSTLEAQTGTGHPIESRDERIVSLSNTLRYQLLRPLDLVATVDLSQRDISRARAARRIDDENPFFDNDISEFHLNGNLQLRYHNGAGTHGMLRVEINERDEQHSISPFEGASSVSIARQELLEEQKNNTIRQTQLALQLSQAVSRRDTLSLSASTVKMQYDTPSDENFDDRDELFVLAGLRWVHRFSPYFQASLSGDVNLRHTVFIFAERSANNTWNRVIRLAPSTELRIGQGVISRNSAEIVANYTVYDFESAAVAQRSYSMRQLTVSDSTLVHLGADFWAEMQLHVRVYERGELRWTAFTVRPVQFFDERTMSLSLLCLRGDVRATAGFRLFEQRRYRYEGIERTRSGLLRSYGPTASLRFHLSGMADIIAEGWYQLTSEGSGATRTTPNLSLRLLWNL